MKKTYSFLLTAGLVLATAFTFSCSSDDSDNENTPPSGTSSSSLGGGSSPSGGGSSSSGGGGKVTTFTDSRDNKTYKSVKIGDQTWMAENSNYDLPNNATNGVCYDNNSANCAKYGRLYNYYTAPSACPSGWHLPSQEEWNTLLNYVQSNSGCSGCDASKLKAKSGWNSNGNGTDDYDFSALPGGYGSTGSFSTGGGGFSDEGSNGYWWSSTEGGGSLNLEAYSLNMGLGDEDEDAAYWRKDNKSTALNSVRCVKDN